MRKGLQYWLYLFVALIITSPLNAFSLAKQVVQNELLNDGQLKIAEDFIFHYLNTELLKKTPRSCNYYDFLASCHFLSLETEIG